MTEWITQLDFAVLHWMRDTLSCGFLDFLMPKISFLGNAGWIWLLAGVILLLIPKYRRHGCFLLVGLAIGALLGNVVMKPLFARPRPCHTESFVPLLIPVPEDYSFPSGHTLSSVLSAVILTNADRRFGVLSSVLAALIAFSRLYLFVHFPSDVLASVLLGIIIGRIVPKAGTWVFERLRKNHTPQ